MAATTETDKCPKCKALIHELVRHCPSCGQDLGVPNVRACKVPVEMAALLKRVERERERAKTEGYLAEFESFLNLVKEKSTVVVAIPADFALTFVNDDRQLYANYEQLVGAGVRSPANFANDSQRRSVAGTLFASYGEKLTYGVLSLDGTGLPTYGDIFCQLKPVAIDNRVSFLEVNSYKFVSEYRSTPTEPFPLGYRADWENRHLLAAAKLGPKIKAGQTAEDWEKMLIVSDGIDRASDDFIEAQIYEGFNLFSLLR